LCPTPSENRLAEEMSAFSAALSSMRA
jgi:hypothetical protein